MPLGRFQLRTLAELRLAEARTLLDAGHHAGAYYLAGYVAELGLKACIAGLFSSNEIPDGPDFRNVRSHNINVLVQLANLASTLAAHRASDSEFDRNWEVLLLWKPEVRYDAAIDPNLASTLIESLAADGSGVLSWIRQHW